MTTPSPRRGRCENLTTQLLKLKPTIGLSTTKRRMFQIFLSKSSAKSSKPPKMHRESIGVSNTLSWKSLSHTFAGHGVPSRCPSRHCGQHFGSIVFATKHIISWETG